MNYPTDLIYHCDPDGNWGMCRRGDLIVVRAVDITPAEADRIPFVSERERFHLLADIRARTATARSTTETDTP